MRIFSISQIQNYKNKNNFEQNKRITQVKQIKQHNSVAFGTDYSCYPELKELSTKFQQLMDAETPENVKGFFETLKQQPQVLQEAFILLKDEHSNTNFFNALEKQKYKVVKAMNEFVETMELDTREAFYANVAIDFRVEALQAKIFELPVSKNQY